MHEAPLVLESREIFSGRVFDVRSDVVEIEHSRQTIEVVAHRGSAAIAAMTGENELILIRQYRHPAKERLWEIPAGVIEPGERADAAALRELREETGYGAGTAELAFSAFASPGFCEERLHVFTARAGTKGEQELDANERVEVAYFTLAGAMGMLARAEICDLKTIAAVLWLTRKYHQ